jgi:hypothetical protein
MEIVVGRATRLLRSPEPPRLQQMSAALHAAGCNGMMGRKELCINIELVPSLTRLTEWVAAHQDCAMQRPDLLQHAQRMLGGELTAKHFANRATGRRRVLLYAHFEGIAGGLSRRMQRRKVPGERHRCRRALSA